MTSPPRHSEQLPPQAETGRSPVNGRAGTAPPKAEPGAARQCPVRPRTLFNRFHLAPDSWIQISPHGQHYHKEGPQAVWPEDTARIVDNWAAAGSPKILVDFDHFSHSPDKPTEAAGWITELKSTPSGLWGKPQWTDTGEAAVTSGRYRFTSPVWTGERGEDGLFHPTELIDVAITNKPNLKGLGAISNRCAVPAQSFPALPVPPSAGVSATLQSALADAELKDWEPILARLAALAQTDAAVIAAEAALFRADLPDLIEQIYASGHTAAALATAIENLRGDTRDNQTTQNRKTQPRTMDKIATALGLPETASEADILAAITALKDGKTALETEVLENRRKEADAAATRHGVTDPRTRETFARAYLANRESALQLLAAIRPPEPASQALTNREPPRNPTHPPATATTPSPRDSADAAWVRNRADAIRRDNPRLSFDQAWDRAIKERA